MYVFYTFPVRDHQGTSQTTQCLSPDLQSSEAKWLQPWGIPHKTRTVCPEDKTASKGKDLVLLSTKGLKRHAASDLHQMVRARSTKLLSRSQPDLENNEREMLVICPSLCIQHTVLTYETEKALLARI